MPPDTHTHTNNFDPPQVTGERSLLHTQLASANNEVTLLRSLMSNLGCVHKLLLCRTVVACGTHKHSHMHIHIHSLTHTHAHTHTNTHTHICICALCREAYNKQQREQLELHSQQLERQHQEAEELKQGLKVCLVTCHCRSLLCVTVPSCHLFTSRLAY